MNRFFLLTDDDGSDEVEMEWSFESHLLSKTSISACIMVISCVMHVHINVFLGISVSKNVLLVRSN